MALFDQLNNTTAQSFGRGLTPEEEQGTRQILEQGGSQLQEQLQNKRMDMAAQKVQEGLKNLNLPQTSDNIRNVVQAVGKGRPLDPQALISQRRLSIDKNIENIKHTLKSDFQIHRYNEAIKEQQRLTSIASTKGLGSEAAKRQALNAVDPNLAKLAGEKSKLLNARLEGFQKQILALDGLENNVQLAEGLDNDIYRDQINSLLTGAPLKDIQAGKVAKGRLAFDVGKEQLAENERARQFGFNESKELQRQKEGQQGFGLRQILAGFRGIEVEGKLMEGIAAKETSGKLGKAGLGEAQQQYITLEKSFAGVVDLMESFDPKAFTFGDKLFTNFLSFSEKLGQDLTPENRKLLGQRRVQKELITGVFNSYRKLITGAAAAEKELEDLRKSILNEKLSPSEAKDSLKKLAVNILRDQMILKELMFKGITAGSAEFEVSYTQAKTNFNNQIRKGIEAQISEKYPSLNSNNSPKVKAIQDKKSSDTVSFLIQALQEKGEPIPPELLKLGRGK